MGCVSLRIGENSRVRRLTGGVREETGGIKESLLLGVQAKLDDQQVAVAHVISCILQTYIALPCCLHIQRMLPRRIFLLVTCRLFVCTRGLC